MENRQSNKIEYENQDITVVNQQNLRDIFGFIKTTSIIPIGQPRKLIDQIVIYRSGTTYRLYISDLTNNTWFFTTLS